jgi:DtxR family Mn-dependent transcriptional regulator
VYRRKFDVPNFCSYRDLSIGRKKRPVHRAKSLSETHEMYLKTLYEVRGRHDVAHVRDLAEGLGVSPSTVSGVIKKMERLGLVDHERYGVIALSETGLRVAECVVRRFEIVRDVLVEIFGVDPAVAAKDACEIEHAISPSTANNMRSLLGCVRAGKLSLPAVPAKLPDDDPCARCEELDACQAAAHLGE